VLLWNSGIASSSRRAVSSVFTIRLHPPPSRFHTKERASSNFRTNFFRECLKCARHECMLVSVHLILIFIYLLTAIGLSPGGSSTVHIYTQTIHRTTQKKQYIEQHNNFGRMRAVPRLG